MTKDQAKALCQLLHIQMGSGRMAFYATAALFGHDLTSTSELAQVAWEKDGLIAAKAAKMFRDIADALESA